MSCWWTGIPVYEALVDKRYPSGEKIMQSSKTEFCIKWIILSALLLPITFVSLFMRRDLVVNRIVNSIMSE
jgi:hypothetical protein